MYLTKIIVNFALVIWIIFDLWINTSYSIDPMATGRLYYLPDCSKLKIWFRCRMNLYIGDEEEEEPHDRRVNQRLCHDHLNILVFQSTSYALIGSIIRLLKYSFKCNVQWNNKERRKKLKKSGLSLSHHRSVQREGETKRKREKTLVERVHLRIASYAVR